MSDHYLTQRVLIDPERLIKLKKQRKSLKFVPSVYQPPQDLSQHNQHNNHNHVISINSQQNIFSDQLRYQFIKKSKNANIDFIVSLLGSIKNEQIIQLQEGDCLDVKYQERFLILEGQIKVTGHNNNSYMMQNGYFFFVSSQSYKKIKQIVCLKQAKVLRISNSLYERQLKNYYFLKNAQKIKYLKYCPFFIWNDQLSQDLASCMKMQTFQKQQIIYSANTKGQKIYFVKEGIVLLQRDSSIMNKFFNQYQNHYQKNVINEQQVTLIVKKGMVFGIDGILLKQIDPASAQIPSLDIINQNNEQNPQINKYNHNRIKLNTRIYTARTIGRTQVYSIHRQVIQTLFNLTDMINNKQFPKILSKSDLQKICQDYSDMVINHKSLPKISQTITRKNLIVQKAFPSLQIQQKKAKAKIIRLQQQLTKKLSIANIIADPKNIKNLQNNNRGQFAGSHDQNASLLNQLNYRLSAIQVPNNDNNHLFAFPVLTSSLKKRNKSPRTDNQQKYIFKWLKDSVDPQFSRKNNQSLLPIEQKKPKAPKIQRLVQSKQKKMNLIKIKSYRSIIQTLL